MECIESEYTPIQRSVTGEIVYLDDMRHQEEFPGYFSRLDEETKAMYEQMAAEYVDLGIRPDILDEYEKYESRFTDVEQHCFELADELLKHKHREDVSFASICIDQPPEKVIDKLKQTKIGSLLYGDDEQLAYESDGSYYPILDIKKKYAELLDVGLSVRHCDNDKFAWTNSDDEERVPGRDILRYPAGEEIKRREFTLVFSYNIPTLDRGGFDEKIKFCVDERGSSAFRSVYISQYMEMGYSGHHDGSLINISEDDVAAMGDLLVEIVGENPISPSERKTQQYIEFLNEIALPESRQYIEEWVDNSWDGQVLTDLQHKLKVDGVPLFEALVSFDLAKKAHGELVYHVDHRRHQKNHWARKYGESPIFNADPPEPWRDGEFRAK